jgi:hypothetical protein
MGGQGATRGVGRVAMLAIVAAAIVPAAAQARVVEPVSVTGQVDVPAGETRSLTLKCPERAVALNGAAPNASSSIPGANARRWTFHFSRSGSAVLRCVRLRLPERVRGVGVVVESKIQPIFEVPPGSTVRIDMRCSRGMIPTGWGLERAGADNGLTIAGAVPSKKGWTFAVENAGTLGAAGTLNARCLEKRQRASSGQHHSFSTRIVSFTEQIEGSTSTSRSCRQAEYAVGTGVSLPATDDITLAGTTLVGDRGGEWSFAQGNGATAITTSLICLARTTGFHR